MTTSALVPSLAKLVQTFFADYLVAQRDLSPHTVLAYRNAMKLYLGFVDRRAKKPITDLGFGDHSPEGVLAYLKDLEKQRGNSPRTRNARLVAMHTFFRFVSAREPQLLDLCQRILAIPIKKTEPPVVVYMEHAEFLHVLATVDRRTPLGRRDYLVLRLLFDTRARAQEIANVRTPALHDRPAQIRLLGKGRKEWICPLRAETIPFIRDYLSECGVAPGDNVPLIARARGGPLTRRGILQIVKRHVARAAPTMPSRGKKSVVAHSLRHDAALHLHRSGNDISTVRSWLGHVSGVTTDHYTEIDAEMKRKALESTEAPAPPKRVPSWERDKDLLAWLEAL